jgi:ferredoxin
MKRCWVRFPGTNFPPIDVPAHDNLANHLTVQNSAILFGCRTGICGTCLSLVQGEIPPPTAEEREVLEILAPGYSQARLACQVDVTDDIAIAPFEEV